MQNIKVWPFIIILIIFTIIFSSCSAPITSSSLNSSSITSATASLPPTTGSLPVTTPSNTTRTVEGPANNSTNSNTTTQATVTKTSSSGTRPSGIPPTSGQGGTPPAGMPPNGAPPSGGPPPGGGGGASSITGTAVYLQSGGTISKSNQDISASQQNESVIKITDSGVYTLTNSNVSSTGNTSSMDETSFYGLNAAILAASGSKITLSDIKITTTGSGANGVFATGTNSTINLANVTISCSNTGAHGVDATIGGILNLNNVNITTKGDGASAAIATDRGGGTINVNGGNVTTYGTKSPPLYSTGEITVTGATMQAKNSEAVVIEGKNSVALTDTTISGAKNWGVMIYQSMSGDASIGTGNFSMNGGTLTSENGPLFYSNNTRAVINLKNAKLVNPSGILIKASAGDWGNAGSNGADVTFTAESENMSGSIICDSISTVNLIFKNATTLKGAINTEHTSKSAALTLDDTSTWEVSGKSYMTSLTDTNNALTNIHSNGYNIYYDAANIVNNWLKGQTYDLTGSGKLTPVS